MSVWANLTGPFAEITVGAGSSAVVFNIPKQLLCDSSTYFKAALNNGFAETATQKITLDDDDPKVFRTYAAWLFEHEITNESIDEVENIARHLFHVFIFADKRGIRHLANDVVTMMSSLWIERFLNLNVTMECLPLIPPRCTLYELTLDNLILESRSCLWGADKWELLCSHPRDIIVELFKRERAFPDSFRDDSQCFQSICHYHKHDNDDEKDRCIEKTERGRNLYADHQGLWEQIEWRW